MNPSPTRGDVSIGKEKGPKKGNRDGMSFKEVVERMYQCPNGDDKEANCDGVTKDPDLNKDLWRLDKKFLEGMV